MSRRVLLVGCNDEAVSRFASALEGTETELLVAASGTEAGRTFDEELPDFVFLSTDGNPDAVETAQRLKRNDDGLLTPLVLVADVDRSRSRQELMRDYGAVDCLPTALPFEKIRVVVDWLGGDRRDGDIKVTEDTLLDQCPFDDASVIESCEGGLVALVVKLERESFSGTVAVKSDQLRRALIFEDGLVVGARSNAATERMERVLLGHRFVTSFQLEDVKRRSSRASGDLIGTLALLGLLPGRMGKRVERLQAANIGRAMLRQVTGRYLVLDDEMMQSRRLERGLSAAWLALVVLRKESELRRDVLEKEVEDDHVFRATDLVTSTRRQRLTRSERHLLELTDGVSSVAEIREIGRVAGQEVGATLAVLVGSRLVAPAPSRKRLEAEPCDEAAGEPGRGELAEEPLAAVLGRLMTDRSTGVLTVIGPFRRAFHLVEGEIVFGRSDATADQLGAILVAAGVADPAVVERARAHCEVSKGRRLGAVLIALGQLTIASLHSALRSQLQKIVDSTLGWNEGTYSFEPEAHRLGFRLRLGATGVELVRRAAGALGQGTLEKRWLRRDEPVCLVRESREIDEASLAPEESELLDRSGSGAGLHLSSLSGSHQLETELRAVEVLVAIGAVTVEAVVAGEEVAFAGAIAGEEDAIAGESSGVNTEIEIPMLHIEPVTKAREVVAVPMLEIHPVIEPSPETGHEAALSVAEFFRRRRDTDSVTREMTMEVGRLEERIRWLERSNLELRAEVASAIEMRRAIIAKTAAPVARKAGTSTAKKATTKKTTKKVAKKAVKKTTKKAAKKVTKKTAKKTSTRKTTKKLVEKTEPEAALV